MKTILAAMTMLVFCLAAGSARAEETKDTDKTVADKHSHTAHSHGSDAHDATGTSKAAPADADADMECIPVPEKSSTSPVICATTHADPSTPSAPCTAPTWGCRSASSRTAPSGSTSSSPPATVTPRRRC